MITFYIVFTRGAREDGKWRNDGLGRKHSAIKNTAAVLEHTTTPLEENKRFSSTK